MQQTNTTKSIKKTIFLFIFLNGFLGFSQMWFPAGAVWKYMYYNFDSRVGYTQVEVVGEQTIDGQLCKKLHVMRYLQNLTALPVVTWTEDYGDYYVYDQNNGNQVYVYRNNQFYKIYDFDANVNDSWIIPNCNVDIHCNTSNEATVAVTDKGVEVINGESLKWIQLATTAGPYQITNKIYQKIGSVGSFLLPDYIPDSVECGLMPADALISSFYYCYNEPSTSFSHGTNCPTIELGTQSFNTTNVSITNQNNVLTIKTTETKGLTIEVYDINGKKLIDQKISENSFEYNTSGFAKGVYVVKVIANQKETVQKIVVE